jgi:hypothetical protein
MYGNIYKPSTWSNSIIDNRKFIKPNALVYEVPARTIRYDEDSLEKKISYTYGQPSAVMNDEASFNKITFGEKALEFIKKATASIEQKDEPATDDDPITPAPTEEVIKNTKDNSNKDSNKDNKVVEHYEQSCSASDDGSNICGGTNLFPIMDPRFNLREAAKNMILLEDHLFHYGKRCQDCILKHCLTIEGFLEEGITLDKKREYSDILITSSQNFRKIFKEIAEKINTRSLQDQECCEYAQRIRQIRKPLCQQFATFIK